MFYFAIDVSKMSPPSQNFLLKFFYVRENFSKNPFSTKIKLFECALSDGANGFSIAITVIVFWSVMETTKVVLL